MIIYIVPMSNLLYHGVDEVEIVAKMRGGEFGHEYRDNREYMDTVAERLVDSRACSIMPGASEEEFLNALQEINLLLEVTNDYFCPFGAGTCLHYTPECIDGCIRENIEGNKP